MNAAKEKALQRLEREYRRVQAGRILADPMQRIISAVKRAKALTIERLRRV